MAKKRVAIVGSGCSGLGALWALKHTDHEVHLYEANDRLGGHTNTVQFRHHGEETVVDTGFIVYNLATYPNFINFLKHVGVKSVPTEMTFGVSRDHGAFEWAGTSLKGIFAQRENIFNYQMWRMIFDIIRFNQFALDLLHEEDESEDDPSGANGTYRAPRKPQRRHETIGEYLDREGYSEAFRENYLIPMTAAVWSTNADKCSLEFPAMTLIRFMWNHHLLSTVAARPSWMTIPGCSQKYVDAIMKNVPQQNVHLSTAVKSTCRKNGRNVLLFDNSKEEAFDHIILACHGDTAMEILEASATDEERSILGNFHTSENVAYLHSDLSLMPHRRATWSSWNILSESGSSSKQEQAPGVCLTYNMNILQHIPTSKYGDVLVTLNPIHLPSADSIQGKWMYHHPLYNSGAIQSQKALPRIQNTREISYAGAWTKYGFHEDGFSSGLKVAIEHLGATLPFEFVDSTFSRGRRPVLGWPDWVVRAVIYYIQFLIMLGRAFTRLTQMAFGMKVEKRSKSHLRKL